MGDLEQFKTNLVNILTTINQDTGVRITGGQPNFVTESVAAAYYFRKKNQNYNTFLCIDIGGGSSDISIWFNKTNIFQTSIHFASRDMFIAPLKKLLSRTTVMDIVRQKPGDGIYTMLESRTANSNDRGSDNEFKYFIETVLFEYYNLFKARLDSLSGEDKDAFNNFKRSVFVAYSGLVYYLANTIAVLLNSSEVKSKIDVENVIEIVFGLSGKGSMLTDWISAYCPLIYSEAEKLIAQKAGGPKPKFHKQFSANEAKTETAIGMICDLANVGPGGVPLANPQFFSGCTFDVKQDGLTKTYKTETFIDTYNEPFLQNPGAAEIIIDKSLQEFDDFVRFFNNISNSTHGEITKISEDKYQEDKKRFWGQVNVVINRTLTEQKRFSPPFITMLTVFLDGFCD